MHITTSKGFVNIGDNYCKEYKECEDIKLHYGAGSTLMLSDDHISVWRESDTCFCAYDVWDEDSLLRFVFKPGQVLIQEYDLRSAGSLRVHLEKCDETIIEVFEQCALKAAMTLADDAGKGKE
jgi:hypothetical protein